MELLTLKITPLSSFATIPKGDTIFGQILSYLFFKRDATFANYLTDEPKLIVSDMMPLGYVYRPNLPLKCFQSKDKPIDKKLLKKQKFISLENVQNAQLHLCEEVQYKSEDSIVKNSINRLSFTTNGDSFAPYGSEEINFSKELWMFVLVEPSIKEKILTVIEEIGMFGFGKEANLGKGHFSIQPIDQSFAQFETSYYMSISPVLINNQPFENIWYEPFTRFGKFGLAQAHKNAFKKPLLMADSASVIKATLNKPYFGASIDNGYEGQPSFVQGYSMAVPITIKDEKCLNID